MDPREEEALDNLSYWGAGDVLGQIERDKQKRLKEMEGGYSGTPYLDEFVSSLKPGASQMASFPEDQMPSASDFAQGLQDLGKPKPAAPKQEAQAQGGGMPPHMAQFMMGAPQPRDPNQPSTNIQGDDIIIESRPQPDAYDQASEAARKNRMVTGIMQAMSGGLETMTGAKSNPQVWQGVQEAANAPLTELKEKRKNRAEEMQMAQAESLNDPNSDLSRAAREMARKVGIDVPEGTTAQQLQGIVGDLGKLQYAEKSKQADRALEAAKLESKSRKEQLEYEIKQEDLKDKRAVKRAKGVAGLPDFEFGSADDAKSFKETYVDAASALDTVNRLLEIDEMDGEEFSIAARAEAESLRNLIVGTLRDRVVGPGAITDSERQLIFDTAPDPAAFSDAMTSKTKLQVLKRVLTRGILTDARIRGAKITAPMRNQMKQTDMVPVTDPNGRPAWVHKDKLASAQERGFKVREV